MSSLYLVIVLDVKDESERVRFVLICSFMLGTTRLRSSGGVNSCEPES